MFRTWRLAAVLALAWSPAASAQDHDWSGFYFGAHAGYGSTDFDAEEKFRELFGSEFMVASDPGAVVSLGELWSLMTPDCFCNLREEDTAKAVYGFQAGYNWQGGKFVFGFETAATRASFSDYAEIDGSYADFLDETPVDSAAVSGFVDFSLGTIITATGRIGIPFDRLLVTGSAGIATTHARMQSIGAATAEMDDGEVGLSLFLFEGDEWVFGWVFGIGAEYALTDRVSLRLDYQRITFDGFDLAGEQVGGLDPPESFPAARQMDFAVDQVTAGVNFRF